MSVTPSKPVVWISARPSPHAESDEPDERLGDLYRQHAGPLYRFLLRLTVGDRHQAEDHLQETLLRACRHLKDRVLDTEEQRRWLFTVARRIVIDSVRTQRARPIEVAGTNIVRMPTKSDDIERLLVVESVRSALMTLSPKHRETLIELFYHHRTAREAAEVMGIPEGTVKSRTYYALRALRRAIDAEELAA